MAKGVVIRRVPISRTQRAFIGKRPLSVSERETLAQRFGLGGTSRTVPSAEASASQTFFSGRSTAPFQGNIRDVRTGDIFSVRSARGQALLAAHNVSVATAQRQQRQVSVAPVKTVAPTVTPQAARIVKKTFKERFIIKKKPPTQRQQAQTLFEQTLQPVGKGFIEFFGTSGELAAQTVEQTLKERERVKSGEIGFFEAGKETFAKTREREKKIAKGVVVQAPRERALRAGGRLVGQISPLLLPGGVGIAAAGVSALGAERFEEAATGVFLGAVVGTATRAAPTAFGLAKTVKIPGITKAAQALQASKFAANIKIPGAVSKTAKFAPLVGGVGFIAATEVEPLATAFAEGDEAFAKQTRSLTASLGAFTLGARAGGLVTGEFLRPFEGAGGAIARRTLVKTGSKKAKVFEERFNRAKQFDKLEAKPRNPDLSKVENLTPKTARIVEKFLKDPSNKTTLGGSAATNAQLPKQIKPKAPGDADLYARNEFKRAEKLFKLLKDGGRDVRFQINRKGAVPTPVIFENVGGKSIKAIEFHNTAQLIQNVGEVRGVFEPFEASFVKSPNGTKMLKLSTQAKRKVIGGTFDIKRIQRTGGKDIIDFEQKIAPAAQFLQPKPTISQKLGIPKITTPKGLGLGQAGRINLSAFAPSAKGFEAFAGKTTFKPTTGFDPQTAKIAKSFSSSVKIKAPSSIPISSGVKLKPASFLPVGSSVRIKTPKALDLLVPSGVKLPKQKVVPSGILLKPQKPLKLLPSSVKIRTPKSSFIGLPSSIKIRTPKTPTLLDIPSGVQIRTPKIPTLLDVPSGVPIRTPRLPPIIISPPSGVPITSLDIPSIISPPPKKQPPIFGIEFPKTKKKKKKVPKQQAFASFVKMKGELVRVSKRPLFKTTARALSMFIVDKSAARTGTIKAIPGIPTGRKFSSNLGMKFRKPIKGGRTIASSNLFIEKINFAIDSPGEKSAITARGLEALRTGFFKKRKKRKVKRRKKK